jgi:hypothetical protein
MGVNGDVLFAMLLGGKLHPCDFLKGGPAADIRKSYQYPPKG